MEGSGKILVTAVGTNSQAGQILKLLGATDESTGCCAQICVSRFLILRTLCDVLRKTELKIN